MNIARYNKAIVALILALIYFANEQFGTRLPVDQDIISAIVVAVIPAAVYQAPNS